MILFAKLKSCSINNVYTKHNKNMYFLKAIFLTYKLFIYLFSLNIQHYYNSLLKLTFILTIRKDN
jgi:hypothetical protein